MSALELLDVLKKPVYRQLELLPMTQKERLGKLAELFNAKRPASPEHRRYLKALELASIVANDYVIYSEFNDDGELSTSICKHCGQTAQNDWEWDHHKDKCPVPLAVWLIKDQE